MGAVFRARQLSLDRAVAVKVLTPRLAKNENFLHRFLREARAVAKLNHPNVVSGIDVGESKGYRYFVMEYVEGPTLQQRLDEGQPLDAMWVTKTVLQVARALDHAHRANLIHRDVKPANIIITARGGVAKLCDLGLAKEVGEVGSDTAEGRAMGTPFYISPEQARGQADIDVRSDLYSLGATYYHGVCGQPPFGGPTPAVIMAKHLTEALVPVRKLRPDAPKGCAPVIERMLRKKRDERYQTPAELIRDLAAVVDGTYREEPLLRPRKRRVRRRRF
jgi:eukaryotic-like serine/threonine-protein kinase